MDFVVYSYSYDSVMMLYVCQTASVKVLECSSVSVQECKIGRVEYNWKSLRPNPDLYNFCTCVIAFRNMTVDRYLRVELLQSAVANCAVFSSTSYLAPCKQNTVLMTIESTKNIKLTMMLHCFRRLKICIIIGFHIIGNGITILTIDV